MNITLFIDADNISYYNYKRIIDNINFNNPNPQLTVHIFGSFSPKLLNRWKRIVNNPSVTFIDIPLMKKKNITDHVIIVHAMKALYTTNLDVFALASDDVDFIPLYEAMRENKKIIWQISQNLEDTKYLENLVDLRIDVSNYQNDESNLYTDEELIEMIDKAFSIKEINGMAALGDVKYWMDTQIDDFSMEKTKFRKFSKLIHSLEKYEIVIVDSDFKMILKEKA